MVSFILAMLLNCNSMFLLENSNEVIPMEQWTSQVGVQTMPEKQTVFSVNDYNAVNDGKTINTKAIQAAERLGVKQILLSGGVAANKALRDCVTCNSPVPVFIPPPSLCTDNAAMIAACGYYNYHLGKINGYDIDVIPSLSFG